MALYAHPWRKSMGLTRGVNLPVGRQARANQPAAGRQLGSAPGVHDDLAVTLRWMRGGGEPWVRITSASGQSRMIPGGRSLWEVILIMRGWDRG